MAKKKRIPHKFQPWIDARKNFKLSDSHIQMARELGLSPKRFGKYADRKDQPWKLPLKEFIEMLYEKQFNRPCPEKVMTIEEMAAQHVARREAKKAAKAAMAAAETEVEAADFTVASETVGEDSKPEASETEDRKPEDRKPEDPKTENDETENDTAQKDAT